MKVTEESNKSKYLIIARVGDSSLHRSWLEPKEFRSFDLCLSYYGEQTGQYVSQCEYYSETEGGKWPAIKQVVEKFSKDIERYEAIWIPDEQIASNAFNISQMFQIFSDQELWLAQPAFTADSYSSPTALLQHPEFILRYIRFSEMTAPVFSPDALTVCMAAMEDNQQGMDFILTKDLSYSDKQIAVIDETPVKLTKTEIVGDIGSVMEETPPPPEPEMIDERHHAETTGTSRQDVNEEVPASEPETPPLFDRKTGRKRRSGRHRRAGKKTVLLKHKMLKKRKLKKLKKPKLTRKLKKTIRLKKPLKKQKRKYPVSIKKKLAA